MEDKPMPPRKTKDEFPVCLLCGRPTEKSEIMLRSAKPGDCICRECASAVVKEISRCGDPEFDSLFLKRAYDICEMTGMDMNQMLGKSPKTSSRGTRGGAAGAAGARNEDGGALSMETIGTPKELYNYLCQYVYGQDEVKKILSVAVYNHYKRLLFERQGKHEEDAIELGKSNVLLLGPSGSGKTLLAQALARRLKVPFAISDATAITEAGYVGEDVENILLRLVQAADYDLSKAEMGIVYVDEIDKTARKGQNVSITRDVSGEGVQQALLKLVEGTVANIPPKGGRKHPDQEYIHLNTKNILFIFAGAFVGLDKIIERRSGARVLGFMKEEEAAKVAAAATATDAEALKNHPLAGVEPEDLITFGMIPEFVGRLPIIAALDELSRDDLVHILTDPKDSIVRQYKALFKMSNVELEFTTDALEAIADLATERHTGARGLRAVIEKTMLDVMFETPSQPAGANARCVIDADVVRHRREAKVEVGG